MTAYSSPLARILWAQLGVFLGIAASSPFLKVPAHAVQVYGAGQCLTAEQISAAMHLKFPQSYAALSSRFGSPEALDSRYDWHCMENSDQYLVFEYSREGLAVRQLFSR